MFEDSLGELLSLIAVVGWTLSALSFETAGKRIGSVPVNIIRLLMAIVLLAIINMIRGVGAWPSGISGNAVIWLLLSGFVGFFLGDLALFRSYLIIGSRLAMLVMSLSPPISALLDWIVFGVELEVMDALGILLTMLGVSLAVTTPKSAPTDKPAAEHPPAKLTGTGSSRLIGFLLAFGGAAGQSVGMILAKLGMESGDAMGATFVRTLGGMAGFIPMMLISGATGRVLRGMKNRVAMSWMSLGAVAGPVFGVSAVLLAMQYSPAGVVSAITAIVPVVIILPSMFILKDKPAPREILGAVIAVAGVVLLILT